MKERKLLILIVKVSTCLKMKLLTPRNYRWEENSNSNEEIQTARHINRG